MDKLELLAILTEDYDIFSATRWIGASEKCIQDLKNIRDGLLKKDETSIKFVDSSTKIPNGLLQGNLIDFGQYDECLSLPDAQFCLAEVSLPKRENNKLTPPLSCSYCIPSSCSPASLQNAFNSFLNSTNSTATVEESHCHTSEVEKFSTLEIVTMCFFGMMIFLCLVATLYDAFQTHIRKDKKRNILSAFSILENSRIVFSTEKTPGQMGCLHGIKFLTIVWIIFFHRLMWTMGSRVSNKVNAYNALHSAPHRVLVTANLGTDTFFFIGAFLNTYSLLRTLDKTHRFQWFKYYFHRILRTLPALAATVLFMVGIFKRLGDGPVWSVASSFATDGCTKYDGWWATLLYVNNYVYDRSDRLCIGQSWYLSVDMQLYCLSPIVILSCRKWPKAKKFILGFLLLLSVVICVTHAYINEVKQLFILTDDEMLLIENAGASYIKTHVRTAAYILGIIFGFFMDSERKSGKKIHLTPVYVFFGWLLAVFLLIFVGWYDYHLNLEEEDHPYNKWESSFCYGLFRLLWSTGVAWVVFACLHGYGGVVNSILSYDFFLPLGRLTYSIYIIHMAVIFYQIGTTRVLIHMFGFELAYLGLADTMASTLVAIPLCLMFEMPILAVEKILTSKPQGNGIANGKKPEERLPENTNETLNGREP